MRKPQITLASLAAQLAAIQAQLPAAAPSSEERAAQAGRLLHSFLDGRNENTKRGYLSDLDRLRKWLGAKGVLEAVARLLTMTQGELNGAIADFKTEIGKSLAPGSINRNLATLKSLFKCGRFLGLTGCSVEVNRVMAELRRDTTPPDTSRILAVLDMLKNHPEPRRRPILNKRDAALIALLFFQALRIQEALDLNLEDLDLAAGKLRVKGKRRTEKITITLSAPAVEYLEDWIAARGLEPGPLFVNFHLRRGRRCERHWAWDRMRRYGLKRCHGMRHAACLEALDATGGNLEKVRKFMRHSSITTTQLYLNSGRDEAGETACLLADKLVRGS